MEKLIVVALGGAAGCVCRYLLAMGLSGWFGGAFPWGTLAVNLLGSGLLAAILQIVASTNLIDPLWRLALTTGFMGGFTTYSTFNFETMTYLQAGDYLRAFAYAAVTGVGCLLSGFAGMALAKALVQNGL